MSEIAPFEPAQARAPVRKLLVLQWGLLVALLAAAPFAMQFEPFQGIYEDGVYEAHHSADQLYPYRAGLIAFGLAASVLSSTCFIVSAVIPRCRRHVGPSFALALTTVTIGWRMYPYWVTGVFNVMSSLSPRTDLDPKALIPMTWIGEFWRQGVLYLYIISIAGVPVITGLVVVGLMRKSWETAATAALCLAVIALVYAFAPGYETWLGE